MTGLLVAVLTVTSATPASALRPANPAQSAGAEELRRELVPTTSQAGLEEGPTQVTRRNAIKLGLQAALGLSLGSGMGLVWSRWRKYKYDQALSALGELLSREGRNRIMGSHPLWVQGPLPATREGQPVEGTVYQAVVYDLNSPRGQPIPVTDVYQYLLLDLGHSPDADRVRIEVYVGSAPARIVTLTHDQLAALKDRQTTSPRAIIPINIRRPSWEDQQTADRVTVVVKAGQGTAFPVSGMAYTSAALDRSAEVAWNGFEVGGENEREEWIERAQQDLGMNLSLGAGKLTSDVPGSALAPTIIGGASGAIGAVLPEVTELVASRFGAASSEGTPDPLAGDRDVEEPSAEPGPGWGALDYAAFFARAMMRENPDPKHVVLGQSVSQRIPPAVLEALGRTVLGNRDRLTLLPAEENQVQKAIQDLNRLVGDHPTMPISLYAEAGDRAAARFADIARTLKWDFLQGNVDALNRLLLSILKNLGVPESVATEANVRGFLNAAAGLEQAA